MTNTYASIKDKTYVMSEHVQSVSTNRTEGYVKLCIAPREILECNGGRVKTYFSN